MATEVRTITDTWCDVCLLRNSERVASVWGSTVTIERMTRNFDLCEAHFKEFIGELPEVLKEYGTPTTGNVKPAQQSDDDARVTCPKCHAELSSRGSLTSHARNVHGKPLAALEMELGMVPSRGKYRGGAREMLRCEKCGKVVFGPQGMGSHLRTHTGNE